MDHRGVDHRGVDHRGVDHRGVDHRGGNEWRVNHQAGTAGVGRVGTPDAVVAIALIALVMVRAIGHLTGRVLVVSFTNATRGRLACGCAVAVAVH